MAMQSLRRLARGGGGGGGNGGRSPRFLRDCLIGGGEVPKISTIYRTSSSQILLIDSITAATTTSSSLMCEMQQRREFRCYSLSLCNKNNNFNNTATAVATALPLRNRKPKSSSSTNQYFIDMKQIKVNGGNGGDGAISFLSLWANEFAGPDGGDGGNGGHVILQASPDVTNLNHIKTLLMAANGENGMNKDCFGKNAEHLTIKVPIGTIVRDSNGKIVADLIKSGTMFIAARGGAGGHGNAFFKSDTEQSPKIGEYGALGEKKQYLLELRTMANVGLIGLPNAGKSTLLRAISRARPKVAPYPFTTLKPHVGVVKYDDYEQIAVADLPGLIAESHKNRGLGITFLKHAERCAALLIVIDMSTDEPWNDLGILLYELEQFSKELLRRPLIVIANKMDLPEAEENLRILKDNTELPIIPISAKMGDNLTKLLSEIRVFYNKQMGKDLYGKKLNTSDDDDNDLGVKTITNMRNDDDDDR